MSQAVPHIISNRGDICFPSEESVNSESDEKTLISLEGSIGDEPMDVKISFVSDDVRTSEKWTPLGQIDQEIVFNPAATVSHKKSKRFTASAEVKSSISAARVSAPTSFIVDNKSDKPYTALSRNHLADISIRSAASSVVLNENLR
jgi:hypothetical protein